MGDLEAWSEAQNARHDPAPAALRSTRKVEIKWAHHTQGQQRPGGWAAASPMRAVSILVRGAFSLRFRSPEHPTQTLEHHLEREGDYVIWREDVEHTWQAQADSVVVTVRWPDG